MNASSTQDRYRAIIEGIGQIPTLPTVVAKAMEILNNPASSADSASRLISQDPALSSKVLRLANSAFYGIPRTISSINSAVVILGFATIKSLVVSASVLKMFSGSAAVKGFDRRAFWRHSVSAAMATRLLARRYSKIASVDVEAAFMAGLLHKVGIMVLDTVMQKELEQCLAAALQSGRPLPELEMERLGIQHAQLGGLLAEKWGLPDELRYPIMEHIDPQKSTIYPEIATLVHLGSHLCESIGVTAFGEVRQWPLHASALNLVKLTEDDLPQLQEDLRQDLEMAQGFFGLIDSAN